MFKLPNSKTPVLCQGITTELGTIHTERALAYGTNIVGGTSADKSIKKFLDVPVFRSVKEAVKKVKPQVSVVFATPTHALSEVMEAIKAKIPMIICTTEHIPFHDILKMKESAVQNNIILIGPSSPGIVRVGEYLIGSIPAHLFPKGNVAIVGRSSSMIYEAVQQLAEEGMGISTCISLGASALIGSTFSTVIQPLLSDKETHAVLIIGAVTGDLEVDLASVYQKKHFKKKVLMYIPGQTLDGFLHPPLLGLPQETPKKMIEHKKSIVEKSGIIWISNPTELGKTVKKELAD